MAGFSPAVGLTLVRELNAVLLAMSVVRHTPTLASLPPPLAVKPPGRMRVAIAHCDETFTEHRHYATTGAAAAAATTTTAAVAAAAQHRHN